MLDKPIKQEDVESIVKELFEKYPNDDKNDGYLTGEIFCSKSTYSLYTKNCFQVNTGFEFVTLKTHQDNLTIEYQNIGDEKKNWTSPYILSRELKEFIVKETKNRLEDNLKKNLDFLKDKYKI